MGQLVARVVGTEQGMLLAKHRCCPTSLPVEQNLQAVLEIQSWHDKSKQRSLVVGGVAGIVQKVELVSAGVNAPVMSLGEEA